jgi:hypothetical protein
MIILLLIAYGVGSAIRFNIRYFEPIEHQRGHAQNIALLSRIVLAWAYFISITYYLELLSAFVLNAFGLNDELYANIITSSLLLLICGIGIWRGLGQLEKIETYAVSLNLGMIVGLLFALLMFNLSALLNHSWQLPDIPSGLDVSGLQVLLGLLIVVQGFETSRYLQDEHTANERITTMRRAQIISSIIYLLFLAMISPLFKAHLGANVTAITHLVAPIAIVLPLLISVAAIGSQFSAAMADTSGAGGLIEDISQRKLPIRYAYVLVLIVTLSLTWESHIIEIIAYASRAFALFYALQCCVAVLVAANNRAMPHRKIKLLRFTLTALVCFAVFVFGIPAQI